MDKCKVCDKDTEEKVSLSLGVKKCEACGNEASVMKDIPLCTEHLQEFREKGPSVLLKAL